MSAVQVLFIEGVCVSRASMPPLFITPSSCNTYGNLHMHWQAQKLVPRNVLLSTKPIIWKPEPGPMQNREMLDTIPEQETQT